MHAIRSVALAAVCSVSLAPAALACGGLFCSRTPVEQAGERILFATDGQNVTAHVQIQYQGDAKDFSWIVPVPTEPKLGVGSEALFTALTSGTRPLFQTEITTDGDCREFGNLVSTNGGRLIGNDAASLVAAAPGVAVVSQQNIGPFETAVLTANDTAKLKEWLTTNGYIVPPAIEPLMDPYVAGKFFFIALKLQKDRAVGELQPIAFSYKSTKPGVPIRLTGVAATPDMGVYVWVLGDLRAVPENYKHAEINEALIDWPSGGDNYPQVVTRAMNEAGGQAFVTDFAGPSSKVDFASQANLKALEAFITELRGKTEPVAFVQALMGRGYLLQQFASSASAPRFRGVDEKVLAILKRHVPKPLAIEASDDAFYANIESYKAQLASAQLTVDANKAADELVESRLKPLRDIEGLFKQHKYLTRLYTTMSPDEMTQDPMFVFNQDLPNVDNVHIAKGRRLCAPDRDFGFAPVELTLKNGLKFVVTGSANGDAVTTPLAGVDARMPAALRIQQMKAAGAPSTIQDNEPAIRKTLGGLQAASAAIAVDATTGAATAVKAETTVRAGTASKAAGAAKTDSSAAGSTSGGGFGCAGCANPAKQAGTGEGVSFTLFALGLAGWRLRLRRNRQK